MDAPTVTLGPRTETLVRPSPFCAMVLLRTSEEIEKNDRGVFLARATVALRACWPADRAWPILERPRDWRVGDDLGETGQAIWDALVLGGIDSSQLVDAVQVAYNWAIESLPRAKEVAGAEDFSGARKAG